MRRGPVADDEAPVRVSAIHVREIAPPEGARRIEWYLLTTETGTTAEEAVKMVDYYLLRWRVEDLFRYSKAAARSSSCPAHHVAATQHEYRVYGGSLAHPVDDAVGPRGR